MTDDWFDMIRALLGAGARFLIVGAHAVAALHDFGAPAETLEIKPEGLVRPGTVIQFGLPPNRIDLLADLTLL